MENMKKYFTEDLVSYCIADYMYSRIYQEIIIPILESFDDPKDFLNNQDEILEQLRGQEIERNFKKV